MMQDVHVELKSSIAMAKAEFKGKKSLFTGNLGLNLGNKLVKCHVWNIAL
jgi:hypothetical protein